MNINLTVLLMLLAVQIMMTVILNSLWRALKKAGFLLKALVLQIPLAQRTALLMKELEETAEQRKTDRRKAPEQRKPTVEMNQEDTEPEETEPARTANPGNQNRKQKMNRKADQNQKPNRNP